VANSAQVTSISGQKEKYFPQKMNELVLTTSSKDNVIQCWNIRTGVVISTFKGNLSNVNCADLIPQRTGRGSSHSNAILSAQSDKNLIHVWPINKSTASLKMLVPEKLTALKVAHSGMYCVGGGASGRIYVWEISTGRMLKMFDAHYKRVNSIQFTVDDRLMVTGSDDASAFCWKFSAVLVDSDAKPHSTLSGHTLPVTQIHVGVTLSKHARVYTVSLDRTCKVWNAMSGELLASVVYERALTSVVVNTAETILYCAAIDGMIYSTRLYKQDFTALTVGSVHQDDQLVMDKHTMRVNQLQMSHDESLLVSSSEDGYCHVWDPVTRQLLRSFQQQKGPTTCCTIFMQPTNNPVIPKVGMFSRYPNPEDPADIPICLYGEGKTVPEKLLRPEQEFARMIKRIKTDDASEVKSLKRQLVLLSNHNQELRKWNDKLYKSTLELI
jgi:pre-rRNA-processing protein IPI3